MSFPDPPPPPPVMLPPFACGDIDDFCPQIAVNVEPLDSHFKFESATPFKKQRYYRNNTSKSAPFQPMNLRLNPANRPMNQGTSHIFYKTRMCLKFLDGKCRNGDHCTFAHGAEDMRDPPPNWQEIVCAHEKDKGAGNWNDDQRIIHRMRICWRFYNGEECPYGETCNFLHENPSKFKTQMWSPRETSAISIVTTGSMMEHRSRSGQSDNVDKLNPTSDAARVDMKSAYWKTKLCSKWETTGRCIFGEKCRFAHGLSELQLLGGRMEAEAVNAVSIPTQPVSVPANNVPPSKMATSTPAKEDGEGKKHFGKWKVRKKINCIYADWIDDMPPPPLSLPNRVET